MHWIKISQFTSKWFVLMLQVKLQFTENALRLIAEKAIAKNTGARGLRSILESILTEAMFEVLHDTIFFFVFGINSGRAWKNIPPFYSYHIEATQGRRYVTFNLKIWSTCFEYYFQNFTWTPMSGWHSYSIKNFAPNFPNEPKHDFYLSFGMCLNIAFKNSKSSIKVLFHSNLYD